MGANLDHLEPSYDKNPCMRAILSCIQNKIHEAMLIMIKNLEQNCPRHLKACEEQINVDLARLWHCSGYTTSLRSTPAHTPGHWVLLRFRLYMLVKGLSKTTCPIHWINSDSKKEMPYVIQQGGSLSERDSWYWVNARTGISQDLSIWELLVFCHKNPSNMGPYFRKVLDRQTETVVASCESKLEHCHVRPVPLAKNFKLSEG